MRTVLELAFALTLGAALVFVLAPDDTLALSPPPALEAEDWAEYQDAMPVWQTPRLEPNAPPSDDSKSAPSNASPTTTRYDLTLVNMHTLEVLPLQHATLEDGSDPEQAGHLSRFLRCRITGAETEMARAPVRVAAALAVLHESRRIEVVSGFRSSKMNEMLRKKGRQVARTSRHTFGQALDFRIPGVGARQMAREAEALHVGGIGTYPVSGFIHIDIGPDRRWRGD